MRFALCYDLTKAYTFVTPQVAQAARDYADLLNLKGGIEGHPVEMIVQDHGNEPQRGIECYEKLKREGVMVFDMLSTPVSRAVLPRVMKDGNIMIQSLAGRGDAVDGDVFKWVFPIGPTYWGQVANDIGYIKQKSGGNLKGVKIAFLYVDYPFGQEPIGILKTLAAKEGFDLQLFPYPLPGNDQASAWTQIRRMNPDWIISWSLSNMHVIASREMKRNGIPIDKYISVNWLNEVDIKNIGPADAKGLKRGTNVAGGSNQPLIQEIIKELYDKGKGNGDRKNLDDVYYNTGLAIWSIATEGARLAIKKDGWPLTPQKIKDGLESIKDYDANGFMAPVTVTAQDHGGGGKTRIEMWDGQKWVPQTDWSAAFKDEVWSVVKAQSADYAKSEFAEVRQPTAGQRRGIAVGAVRPVCLKGLSADRLRQPEFPDLVGRQAEFAEYFVGMLAEQRRRPSGVARRAIDQDRVADPMQGAGNLMIVVDDHSAGPRVRMVKQLQQGVDGRTGDTDPGKLIVPECRGLRRQRALNVIQRFFAVFYPIRIGPELGIVGDRLQPGDAAELPPQIVVRNAEHDRAIGRLERLIGTERLVA